MKIIIRWYFKVPNIEKSIVWQQFKILGIWPHLRRRVVHLGPKYPQDYSNVNNFSIKWNKKVNPGI